MDASDDVFTPVQLWRALMTHVPSGIVVFRAERGEKGDVSDFTCVDLNARAEEIFGRSREHLVGAGLRTAFPPLSEGGLFGQFVDLIEQGSPLSFDQRLSLSGDRSGRTGWYAVSALPLKGGFLAVLTSINERKAILEEAVQLLQQDDLTGIGNRRLVKSRFWVWRQANEPMSLLFFDLDGFKQINDQHGHEIGDRVLQVTAARLRRNIRPSEVVARIGGDEFCVLLNNDREMQVRRVAERLRKILGEGIEVEGRRIAVGASVGYAIYPLNGDSFEALLSHGDRAMYKDKALLRGDDRENPPRGSTKR